MNYGFGKTFYVDDKFTALNGCVQYFKLTTKADCIARLDGNEAEDAKELKVAEAQANLLRVLEILRTYGGQPIITRVEKGDATGSVIRFTLEQANVYGDSSKVQPSAKNWETDAKTKIDAMFKLANGEYVKAVKLTRDAEGKIVEDKEHEGEALVEADFITLREAFK